MSAVFQTEVPEQKRRVDGPIKAEMGPTYKTPAVGGLVWVPGTVGP